MKRTILSYRPMLWATLLELGTIAMASIPAHAQDNSAPTQGQDQAGPPNGGRGGAGQRQEHQLEYLTKQLSLTLDQVTQVKAIDDDSRKQAMALHEDSSVAPKDKRAKMMEIHKAAQAKIRALLTEEQKAKFDAIQARRENRGGGPSGPIPPPQDQ